MKLWLYFCQNFPNILFLPESDRCEFPSYIYQCNIYQYLPPPKKEQLLEDLNLNML